jgi:dTDP-4-dehydrorhamnose reductase
MKRILITGADGQLGRAFTDFLKNAHQMVFGFTHAQLDITNVSAVQQAIDESRPDVVINCAAYNNVDGAENDFSAAMAVNAKAVKHLTVACREIKAVFIHFSTDAVFDGEKGDFYTEDDAPRPINRYGESKRAGEIFLSASGARYLLFRTSWVFGQGKTNFFYRLRQWAKGRSTLKVATDQAASPTFTEDIAVIAWQAVQKNLKGLYHLVNTGSASKYRMAEYYATKAGLNIKIEPGLSQDFPSPARRPVFSALSNKKLSHDLNITIPTWQDAVDRFVARPDHE